ncbi:GAF domain-containing protein [Halobaculum lipolyticum]|uniref:GAF domain-containing protein n=1 Tax=Halobaculum lipolyticum TaxID=3032001 RepID=A0ABD5W8H0_9EURY|nr:GAF domain-containing protein [Halobaculum sp. DT31]
MTRGEPGAAGGGTASDATGVPAGELVLVSGDEEWADRVAAATAVRTSRLPADGAGVADADLPTDIDGYPAAVVVDGAATADPIVPFAALSEAYPDAACILAGGGGRVARDADDTDGRSVVLEYVPDRDPAAVAATAEFAVERRTHRGYPVARGEDDRVAAARAVAADRLASDGLDDLARAAVRALDATAATVALLGEYRLRIVGASHDRLPSVVDRARSISTYTVLEGGVHLVPDIAADPRFDTGSRALEFDFRSYAGVALRVDGAAVGSLSTFRDVPGTPSAGDRETIRLLAAVAEALLTGATQPTGDGPAAETVRSALAGAVEADRAEDPAAD